MIAKRASACLLFAIGLIAVIVWLSTLRETKTPETVTAPAKQPDESLKIAVADQLSADSWNNPQRLVNLESLTIIDALTIDQYRSIGIMPNLKHVSAESLTDDQLIALSSTRSIETLYVRESYLTSRAVEALCQIATLKTLGIAVPGDSVVPLLKCVRLQKLVLNNPEVADDVLLCLKDQRELHSLTINLLPVTAHRVEFLANISTLEHLRLTGELRAEQLQILSNLRLLKSLRFFGQITEENMRALAGISTLENVFIYSKDSNLEALSELSALKNLRQLTIQCPSLVHQREIQSVQDSLPKVKVEVVYD